MMAKKYAYLSVNRYYKQEARSSLEKAREAITKFIDHDSCNDKVRDSNNTVIEKE